MSLLTDLGNRLFGRQSTNSQVTTGKSRVLNKIKLNKLDYETSKIILDDIQVIVGFDIIKYLLSSKNWTVKGEDTEKTDFIIDMFNNMNIKLNDVIKNMLTGILYGFSVQELLFDVNNDGKIIITDIVPIHIKTLQNDPLVFNDNGELIAIHQEWEEYGVDIPINKVLKYTFNDKFDSGYGYGVLNDFKPIVEDKLNINQWEMNFLESYGAPTLYGKTDDFNKEFLVDALSEVSDGLSNVVVGPDDEVGVLETTKNGEGFKETKQYKDNQIFRRLYIGNLLLGDNSQTGTYAQSQTQLDFSLLVFDGILEEIANCIQKQIIEPVLNMNFNDNTVIPELQFDKFRQGDYSKLLSDLKPLIDGGIIDSENQVVQDIISQYIDIETGLNYENTFTDLNQEDLPPENEDLTNKILGDLNAINTETK